MAGWRASAAMKDLAKGKEREGGKRLRADGAAEGTLALGQIGGSLQPSALGAPGFRVALEHTTTAYAPFSTAYKFCTSVGIRNPRGFRS